MSDRLEQLTRLYDADPNDPFLTYGIALEYAKAGRQNEALTWLDRTLEADPAYSYAYYQKGRLLDELGRGDDARKVLREGIVKARETGDSHGADEMEALLETIGGW